jgi:glycosyltransferase involved in cell wall biosynthesis
MKVNLFVSKDIEEPHADIHTNELTDNITKAMSILESDDANDMAAKMLWALEHPQEVNTMIMAAQKEVQKYSWDNVKQQLMQIYG